jgi:hypothetical protein
MKPWQKITTSHSRASWTDHSSPMISIYTRSHKSIRSCGTCKPHSIALHCLASHLAPSLSTRTVPCVSPPETPPMAGMYSWKTLSIAPAQSPPSFSFPSQAGGEGFFCLLLRHKIVQRKRASPACMHACIVDPQNTTPEASPEPGFLKGWFPPPPF